MGDKRESLRGLLPLQQLLLGPPRLAKVAIPPTVDSHPMGKSLRASGPIIPASLPPPSAFSTEAKWL